MSSTMTNGLMIMDHRSERHGPWNTQPGLSYWGGSLFPAGVKQLRKKKESRKMRVMRQEGHKLVRIVTINDAK